jgi:hypothetical protein
MRRKPPSERPSHGNKVLGGIEKKYSGGVTYHTTDAPFLTLTHIPSSFSAADPRQR